MNDAEQKAKEAEWRTHDRRLSRYEPDLCRCGECIANRKERRKQARLAKGGQSKV